MAADVSGAFDEVQDSAANVSGNDAGADVEKVQDLVNKLKAS